MDPLDPYTAAETAPMDDRWWALLERYLAGNTSSEEAAVVRAWLNANPANHDALADVQRVQRVFAVRPAAKDVDVMWRATAQALDIAPTGSAVGDARDSIMRSGIRGDAFRDATQATRSGVQLEQAAAVLEKQRLTQSSSAVPSHVHHHRWFSGAKLVSVAVAAAMVIVLGLWSGSQRSDTGNSTMREFATAKGQRTHLELPDGSRVILSADSRIRYANDFGTSSEPRFVDVVGEAYFSVIANPSRPFVVRSSDGGVAQVLGTRFTVRAYPADSVMRVVVSSGKIALRTSKSTWGSGVTLTAGDLGEISRMGVTTVAHHVDTTAYVGWTEGKLSFQSVPLIDIARELERWYDVDIAIPDRRLALKRVTVSLDNESADDALNRIAMAVGAHAKHEHPAAGRHSVVFVVPK